MAHSQVGSCWVVEILEVVIILIIRMDDLSCQGNSLVIMFKITSVVLQGFMELSDFTIVIGERYGPYIADSSPCHPSG